MLPIVIPLVGVGDWVKGCKEQAEHAGTRALDVHAKHGILVAVLDEGDRLWASPGSGLLCASFRDSPRSLQCKAVKMF